MLRSIQWSNTGLWSPRHCLLQGKQVLKLQKGEKSESVSVSELGVSQGPVSSLLDLPSVLFLNAYILMLLHLLKASVTSRLPRWFPNFREIPTCKYQCVCFFAEPSLILCPPHSTPGLSSHCDAVLCKVLRLTVSCQYVPVEYTWLWKCLFLC